MLNKTNFSGDGQADLVNHGGEHKAVYGFSADPYPFWQQRLDRPELVYGQFGENLTIEGLDESRLCIGDRLAISNAVLEITQPRVPCFKLGLAFELNAMPRLFVGHAATGIYFRVIECGEISAGDPVALVHNDPCQITVQALFKAYFDQTIPEQLSQEILLQAKSIEALSTEWREKVLSRLN